jgi:hypothetical protein
MVHVPQHHATNDQSAKGSYLGSANLEKVMGFHHHTHIFLRTTWFEDYSAIGLSVKVHTSY